MTEKPDDTQDNEIDNPPSEAEDPRNGVNTEDLDIEGALAAVASLQELTREPEPEEVLDDDDVVEIQEFERVEDDEVDDFIDDEVEESVNLAVSEDDEVIQISDEPSVTYETAFPHPPMSVLHRGQLASVVPAVLLIGIGGYLTFVFTTSEVSIQPILVIAIALVVLGIVLLSQWLSSARWTIGSFFLGLSFLLVGATSTYLTLPTNLSWLDGYPLLITAIGIAFVMTDIVVPSGRRVWLIGLILAIVGLGGVVATTILTDIIVPSSGILLTLAVGIIVVLLILPLIFRRSQ